MLHAVALQKLAGRNHVAFIAKPGKGDLTLIGELIATGKVTPVIDRQYPLREVPEVIRYFEEGRVCGKVVITVQE
jgi:NADPH:quinone reductase-like Zn-dependent oxidoreductase